MHMVCIQVYTFTIILMQIWYTSSAQQVHFVQPYVQASLNMGMCLDRIYLFFYKMVLIAMIQHLRFDWQKSQNHRSLSSVFDCRLLCSDVKSNNISHTQRDEYQFINMIKDTKNDIVKRGLTLNPIQNVGKSNQLNRQHLKQIVYFIGQIFALDYEGRSICNETAQYIPKFYIYTLHNYFH